MAYLPRGIDPQLLLSQVKNTIPYIFNDSIYQKQFVNFTPARIVRQYAEGNPDQPLSHFEYFRLCVSAHYLTCATPVPTDVDNQIRRKLWPAQLPLEAALAMSQLVIESHTWNFTCVSTRYVGQLGGHLGEWFTLSCAAYCALRQYKDPQAEKMRQELLSHIVDEINRHSEEFGSFWRAFDGLACLKASAQIAHNFGDLDRVMDMWELPIDDPLRREFYKLASSPFDPNRKLRFMGRLWVAGELYKSIIDGSSMALENHRHFALRKPKCLRTSPAFLIPIGPFFDSWGRQVAQGEVDLPEVIQALKYGWERLPKTLGYGRALRGIADIFPQLPEIQDITKRIKLGQAEFEKKWHEEALKHMDDIPSRA